MYGIYDFSFFFQTEYFNREYIKQIKSAPNRLFENI